MKSRSLQEWSNFSGMYGTISTAGTIMLHELEPKEVSGNYVKSYFMSSGQYIALPKNVVTDCERYGMRTKPE